MSDYPDPDEEHELMYADEYELMREAEENQEPNVVRTKAIQAKRSLDFSSPVAKKPIVGSESNKKAYEITNDDISSTPSLQPVDDVLTPNLQITEDNSTVVTSSNKRTVDDLFGDINDIDFDEVSLPSKRQKTDEEKDTELIETILKGRKLKQSLLEPTVRGQTVNSNYNIKENLSLNIPRWAFLPLTNSDSERVYVKLESEESWEKNGNAAIEFSALHAGYAGVWEEARKILEQKEKEKAETELSHALPAMEIEAANTIDNDELWVDKYKPKSYVDLLSEEPVNRALLHWLHLWDKVVFKKEVKIIEPTQRNSFSKRTGQFQLTNKWKGKKETEPELDEDGRPHLKVALLCGPPGVGKTTLAHLLAKLAGYRPVELNASDERSVDAFRNALQSATLMRSVLDAEKRPNCLILDEIDGAPLPTVELLVKWCTASKTEGKKKGKTQPLRRPVIAICNDLYAPALRPLRPISQIIHINSVSESRLASRLSAVSGSTCSALLAAAAKRARGDIRQALHTLSFLAHHPREKLSVEDLLNANVGVKDCNKNLMQALQSVFVTSDAQEPVKHALTVISAYGEYDRIIDGIFENYLQSRVDARLLIACETLNWLRHYDVTSSWTLRRQNYSLYATLPLCAAACCPLLATRNHVNLKFPMQAQEMSRKKAEIESIISSVSLGSRPGSGRATRVLALDLLPLLPALLAPQLRNPNVQLCSENERKSLRTAAAAMCDYGLQYVQQRTVDGLYAFGLEPDIYKVAYYGNEEKARPPPAVRQAIAREQQLENIRRTEAMSGRVIGSQIPTDDKIKTTEKAVQQARLPNHLQRLKPKEVEKITPQVHKDFFGRIVPIVQCSQRLADGSRDVIAASSVFYQYREGFNNAVRRAVRMQDLL